MQHVLNLPENPFARFPGTPGVVAILGSDIKDMEAVKKTARARLLKEVPGADLRLRKLSGSAGVHRDGYPLDFALRGTDAAAVRKFGERLAERLKQTGKLTDIVGGSKIAPQIQLDIDRTKAKEMGLSTSDVFEVLQVAFGSFYVNDFNKFGRTWSIQVQLDAQSRQSRGHQATQGPQQQGRNGASVQRCDGQGDRRPDERRSSRGTTGGDSQRQSGDWRLPGRSTLGVRNARRRSPQGLTASRRLRLGLAARSAPGQTDPGRSQERAKRAPPEDRVAQPVKHVVTDYQDFTGRMEAVQSVDLRARVSGYLDKVLFKEGSQVKKGEVLFVIDPRPYQAAVDQAQANLKVAEAQRELSKRQLERVKAAGGRHCPQELDVAESTYRTAEATVVAAKAAVEIAKLNLEWTKVQAPIDGRIGRSMMTPGNLVRADETLLANIVNLGSRSICTSRSMSAHGAAIGKVSPQGRRQIACRGGATSLGGIGR